MTFHMTQGETRKAAHRVLPDPGGAQDMANTIGSRVWVVSTSHGLMLQGFPPGNASETQAVFDPE